MKEIMKKKPERNYKDRLFRMIFSDRKELLSLYNAVNDTEYTDSEALEINTQTIQQVCAFTAQTVRI